MKSVSSSNWHLGFLFLTLLVAFALSFFNLGARTLHGDEFGSIAEAITFGRNANSLPYFLLLRFWIILGNNEFWLRSFSVFAGVGAIAITFAGVKELGGRSLAQLVALLLATSPFLVVYNQQVRFYSLAVLIAGISLWTFFILLKRTTSRTIIAWMIAGCLAVLGLFMNLLLVFGQILTLFGITRRLSPRVKLTVIFLVLAIAFLLLVVPFVRQIVFDALATYTNANVRYNASRGLAFSHFAKIPMTLFFFIFGESVYPLNLWLVLPGFLIYGTATFAGLIALRDYPHVLMFVLVTIVFALVLLFLVFDPLAPPDLQGAAPRYLIFLLPLFYLVVAAGVQSQRSWLMIPLLLVNFGSLMSYWFGDWAYTDDLVNWRQVTQWVGNYITPQTLILADGRAQASADYYFPVEWNRQGTWGFQTEDQLNDLADYSRIVWLSYNFHADARVQATTLMQKIARRYDQTAVWNKYPLFVNVYDRKPENPNTYRVDASTGRVNLPLEIYGLEFQDLRLPLALTLNHRTVESTGAFGLPGFDRQVTRTIPFSSPMPARALWLASNLVGASTETGKPIGYLNIIDENGAAQKILLRYGFETSAWNQPCQPNACAPAFTWRKRLALLGAESYAGSWQEFDASIFVARIDFAQAARVRAVEFERVDSPGVLYIWGIVFQQ